MTTPSISAACDDLAPTGVLHVGLNLSNFLLIDKSSVKPEAFAPRGIVPDLARELGQRLGVPVEFTGYQTPGKLSEAAGTGAWDVAFLAAEPARAKEISFTPAYLEIGASYLVPARSPLQTVADIDREGVRIAVGATSAYDLFLTRTLKHAQLVRVSGLDASFNLFVDEQLDALAGLMPKLLLEVQKLPGARILEGGFMTVQQAIGTPKNRGAGAEYLCAFAEDIKASGLVAEAIARNGVSGVSVAP